MRAPFAHIFSPTRLDDALSQGARIPWPSVAARLASDGLTASEFAAAIFDTSDEHLEELARAAVRIRSQRFGNAIKLYAPLYLSNACVNDCPYCGFRASSRAGRRTLSRDEAIAEADALIERGHRHLLLVAGEDDDAVPFAFLEGVAQAIRPRVASLAVEVRPMNETEYRQLASAGVDGVTLYQETYQLSAYQSFHGAGPKADFHRRLAAIEHAGAAGMRFLGIGALLGLADWRMEALALYFHASYLQRRFWRSHITISVPRLRTVPPGFEIPRPVEDHELVRMIVALRSALPDVGIIVSTRERAALRDRLLPLGITQMSAGSRTEPGGYGRAGAADEQFAVEDARTPADVAARLRAAGFDPVFKDWETCLHGGQDANRMD